MDEKSKKSSTQENKAESKVSFASNSSNLLLSKVQEYDRIEPIVTKSKNLFDKAFSKTQNLGLETVGSFQKQSEHALFTTLSWINELESSFVDTVDQRLMAIEPTIVDHLPFLTSAISATRNLVAELDTQYKQLSTTAAASIKALPIAGYDSLTANQVVKAVRELSSKEIQAVRHYEANHKNRTSIIRALDKAGSAKTSS